MIEQLHHSEMTGTFLTVMVVTQLDIKNQDIVEQEDHTFLQICDLYIQINESQDHILAKVESHVLSLHLQLAQLYLELLLQLVF